jgi:hypothetical protein
MWTAGGGALTVTLNGATLTNVYCVDPFTEIYANTWYNQTTANYTGTIITEPLISNITEEQIAWLMETYATSAASNVDQQSALQAAIWSLEGLSVASNPLYSDLMNNYLGSIGTNTYPVSDLLWINPSQNGPDHEQGFAALISSNPSVPDLATVPEPSSLTLFGLGAVALLRKRRRNVE